MLESLEVSAGLLEAIDLIRIDLYVDRGVLIGVVLLILIHLGMVGCVLDGDPLRVSMVPGHGVLAVYRCNMDPDALLGLADEIASGYWAMHRVPRRLR
jgi:hypothetical protein